MRNNAMELMMKIMQRFNYELHIYYIVININMPSSTFLKATLTPFAIFSFNHMQKEVEFKNHSPLFQHISVNVRPYISSFPIFIVCFSNVDPFDLWIFKFQAVSIFSSASLRNFLL